MRSGFEIYLFCHYNGGKVRNTKHFCGDSFQKTEAACFQSFVFAHNHNVGEERIDGSAESGDGVERTFKIVGGKSIGGFGFELIVSGDEVFFGGFGEDRGTVNYPIGRHPIDRKKMAVLLSDESAREAITHYEVLARYGNISYLALKLETGRTHQIRVHMSYTGHALLGDEVYAKSKTQCEKKHPALFSGQALHAIRLTLTHPKTNERMTFECELPSEFKKALEILDKEHY